MLGLRLLTGRFSVRFVCFNLAVLGDSVKTRHDTDSVRIVIDLDYFAYVRSAF